MAECEVCKKDTVCESVDYGDKCIFHCDKSDEAKWGNPDSKDVKRFWRAIRHEMRNEKESSYAFVKHIFPAFEDFFKPKADDADGQNFSLADENNQTVLVFDKDIEFFKVVFTKTATFRNIQFKRTSIHDSLFNHELGFNYCSFEGGLAISKVEAQEQLLFLKCEFTSDIVIRGITTKALIIANSIFNNDLIFRDIQRVDNIKIAHCDLKENFEFSTLLGTLSESSNNIYKLVIEKNKLQNINISQLTTNGLVFGNNKFAEKSTVNLYAIKCSSFAFNDIQTSSSNITLTDLKVSQFVGFKNVLLDKVEFNGFDLHSCVEIRLDNVSFIGSHLTNIDWGEINENRFKGTDGERLDRQMARQLKSINDAQGETVIANDFYALEMRLRSKELNWREHFGEKLVQNIHGLISNHSNDWALPTIWFFAFAFLFAALAKGGSCALPLLLLFVVIGHGIYEVDKPTSDNSVHLSLAILGSSLILFCLFSCDFEFLVALVNPLNFKDSKDLLGDDTNLVLIYACRIIELFIGYQIITAIRKNTRRK